MNATSEPVSHPSVVNLEALEAVAQWLKHHGTLRVRKTDPRRALGERDPQGVSPEAELDALRGVCDR